MLLNLVSVLQSRIDKTLLTVINVFWLLPFLFYLSSGSKKIKMPNSLVGFLRIRSAFLIVFQGSPKDYIQVSSLLEMIDALFAYLYNSKVWDNLPVTMNYNLIQLQLFCCFMMSQVKVPLRILG